MICSPITHGDPHILVAQGASRDFNPSLPKSVVQRAMERDEAAARAEYLGEFRSDVEQFLTREAVEAVVIPDRRELPPQRQYRYCAFVDPSGGSCDAMTFAISHRETDTMILDAIREIRPPFSPEVAVEAFADFAKKYRVTKVIGDAFGGEFVRKPFRRFGLNYELSKLPKSALYLELLPMINSGMVDLLDHERLIHELTGLERRTSRGGRESIDHRAGGHDDIANAVAGSLIFASRTSDRSQRQVRLPRPILAYAKHKHPHGLSKRHQQRIHRLAQETQ